MSYTSFHHLGAANLFLCSSKGQIWVLLDSYTSLPEVIDSPRWVWICLCCSRHSVTAKLIWVFCLRLRLTLGSGGLGNWQINYTAPKSPWLPLTFSSCLCQNTYRQQESMPWNTRQGVRRPWLFRIRHSKLKWKKFCLENSVLSSLRYTVTLRTALVTISKNRTHI